MRLSQRSCWFFFFFFNFFETLKGWTVGTCKKERGLIGQPFMSLSFGRTY